MAEKRGPIACRDGGCSGGCGLRSIHYYGEGAESKLIPSDEEVREFARKHHLNIDRAVAANRGVPLSAVAVK
jgi:hypothetical protein